jgi:hypothetical protein
MGVSEGRVGERSTDRDQAQDDVVLWKGPAEVERDSGGTSENVGDGAFRGERTLNHCAPPSGAVRLEVAFDRAGFAADSGCCSSQDLNCVSRLKMNCKAWLTT